MSITISLHPLNPPPFPLALLALSFTFSFVSHYFPISTSHPSLPFSLYFYNLSLCMKNIYMFIFCLPSYPFTLLTQLTSFLSISFSSVMLLLFSILSFACFCILFFCKTLPYLFHLPAGLGLSSVSHLMVLCLIPHTLFLSNMQHLLSFSFYIHSSSEWVTWICLTALQPLPSAAQKHIQKPIVWLPPCLTCPHLCVWVQVCVIEPGMIRKSAFVR